MGGLPASCSGRTAGHERDRARHGRPRRRGHPRRPGAPCGAASPAPAPRPGARASSNVGEYRAELIIVCMSRSDQGLYRCAAAANVKAAASACRSARRAGDGLHHHDIEDVAAAVVQANSAGGPTATPTTIVRTGARPPSTEEAGRRRPPAACMRAGLVVRIQDRDERDVRPGVRRRCRLGSWRSSRSSRAGQDATTRPARRTSTAVVAPSSASMLLKKLKLAERRHLASNSSGQHRAYVGCRRAGRAQAARRRTTRPGAAHLFVGYVAAATDHRRREDHGPDTAASPRRASRRRAAPGGAQSMRIGFPGDAPRRVGDGAAHGLQDAAVRRQLRHPVIGDSDYSDPATSGAD